MVKPTNVLVPLDFGPISDGVLSYASLLASGFDAKLHVLHVVTSAEIHGRTETPRLYDEMEKEARERLAELIQSEAADQAGRAETAVAIGVPFAEILRYAESNGINLIVMGSHGMTSLMEKIMVGSVAEKVVRRAHCPVVVVRQPPQS